MSALAHSARALSSLCARRAGAVTPRTTVRTAPIALRPRRLAATTAGSDADPVRDISFSDNGGEVKRNVSDSVLALGVFEGAMSSSEFQAWDTATDGEISALVKEADFEGKPGTSCGGRVRLQPAAATSRIVLLGLGAKPAPGAALPVRSWKAFGSAAAAAAKAHKASQLVLNVFLHVPDAEAQQAIAAGVLLGAFDDTRFKSKPKTSSLTTVAFEFRAAPAFKPAQALASGAILARQLVGAPPNVATPSALAETARQLASSYPDVLTVKILEKEDCERLKMGAFLGVAQASDEPLKFIHITYTPRGGAAPGAPVLALVGKGLTFDSGGYNIKAGSGSMIELMKFDMGGAAAVLGAAKSLAQLEPPGCSVHFVIASCENMIGSRGLRPGDILTASNGKTIEVNNTDAEGRLTLADALTYVQRECGATRVVDIATLTGACMVALGTGIAGLWSPQDELAAALVSAGDAAGEKLWRMPLEDAYWDQMKSDLADCKNTGMGKGGAITAALFLKEWIQKDVSWAHCDIAGPVWDDKLGATGFGAATLTHWVLGESRRALP